jgi:antitoxin component YwqK of YwqJK toxin-antitoxin module
MGCKSAINQVKNNKQEGKWIITDTLDYPYTTIGRYKKGMPVGTWKYIYNNKIDRKERYKKKKCITTFYYSNGKKLRKGITKLDYIDNKAHWYYSGKWQYFNVDGTLQRINYFENGKIKDSILF